MELSGPDIFRMYDRRKLDFVVRRCEDNLLRCGLCVVGVNEVNETRFRDAVREAISTLPVELVPAHVRHAQVRRKFHNPPLKQIEPAVISELLTICEEKVHAEADAKRGCAGVHVFDERFRQTKLMQVSYAVAECSDPGQDEL